MIELIKFQIKRRFLNKSQLLLFVLTFSICGLVFFADKVVTLIDKDILKDFTVYLSKELYQDKELFEENKDSYLIQEYKNDELKSNEVKLSYINDEFVVISNYTLDEINKAKIEYIISSYLENVYYQQTGINKEENTININYKAKNEVEETNLDKENIATLILTAVYFTALSYSTSIATEVSSEKLTHILDLTLTCVDCKKHFYSKIITGWISIIIQSGFTFASALFWYATRKAYDNTKGLMIMARKFGLFTSEAKTLKQLFKVINPNNKMILILFSLFVFVVLGILLIQLIIALISSYCTNIDESNGIQAISYILLMGIYYLSIICNNQISLSKGIGKYLSFVPIFSMLFMPSRIVVDVVSWYEVLISAVISLSCILLIVDFGTIIYENGILDNRTKEENNLITKLIFKRKKQSIEKCK